MDNKRLMMTMAAVSMAVVIVPRRQYEAEPEFKLGRRKRRDHPTLADSLGKRRFIKSSKR